ncbi:MAG TPA: helix-turn-helix transcriptional regulator [Nitrolancea sp.]|nr:helix-turn-helix transcriptional regulator [Nitrolancea sp.]
MANNVDLGSHYRQAIGQTIAACRAERGLSLRALADSSNLSLAYLSELERGQKEPSGSTLEQLTRAFDLPLADLLRLVADRIEEQSAAPEVSVEGLGREEIGELSRFAQWLRWKKEQPG